MKILFLSDYFSTWDIGGATRVLSEQIHGLITREDVVVELISGYPGIPDKERELPIKWSRCTYKRAGYLSKLISLIKQRLDEFKPDIVHIHQPLIGALARQVLPKTQAVVYHFHSFWYEEKLSHAGRSIPKRISCAIKAFIEKRTLKHMRHAIALSEFSKDKLQAQFPKIDVAVIPGCIEPTEWPWEKDKVPFGEFRFLAVRRLDPRMGLDNLLRAFKEFSESHDKPVRLDIVGQGRMLNELTNLARELQLEERVRFHGRVEQDELHRLMNCANGMLVPSKELEGFGMIVIESFAMGLPVLGTTVGGLATFKAHPEVFFPLESSEVPALVAGMNWATQNLKNTQEIGVKARKLAESEYSRQAMIEKLLQLYQSLANA